MTERGYVYYEDDGRPRCQRCAGLVAAIMQHPIMDSLDLGHTESECITELFGRLADVDALRAAVQDLRNRLEKLEGVKPKK